MHLLTRFSQSRLSWSLLLLSGLLLELSALFFQYGMKLEPCIMCIYIRVAVIGIMLAGLVGSIAPKFWAIRFIAMTAWLVSSVWGLKLALELNQLQVNPSPFASCSFFAEFPDFMPLDKWLPVFFEPRGMCSDIPWTFLNYTMTQWVILVFGIYILLFLIMLAPTLKPTPTQSKMSNTNINRN
ncbi:disulfide bond formation protein DsbB [Shewanella intestini]|uniref:Disulfide bond formation protein B n=1 Tax=Shewanella intestini TaxID=2017544 RepID=A0ABS5HZU2_9GAMM|nr:MULTISPECIES: disulfide bond formation protein DsbB [Shewanella]MBR9727098.1 disulfide bond formation protein DsbB [Shewanella intestini]MRG35900.1 disulfide bond formation protein DsbB [Shewanella sp. XMDDZSB0408]